MYHIDFRFDLNLLDIKWTGLFTDEAVAEYAAVLRRRFAEEGFQAGYLLRIDLTESAVQPQDVLESFARHLGDFPKAGRIAMVTPSVIVRMQVRRVMKLSYMRIFPLAEPALDWLLGDEVAGAD